MNLVVMKPPVEPGGKRWDERSHASAFIYLRQPHMVVRRQGEHQDAKMLKSTDNFLVLELRMHVCCPSRTGVFGGNILAMLQVTRWGATRRRYETDAGLAFVAASSGSSFIPSFVPES